MQTLLNLFRRAPSPVSIAARSAAELDPVSGLVGIEIDLVAKTATPGRLTLSLPGRKTLIHDRALDLAEGRTSLSLTLHGQLLARGLQEVTIRFTPAHGAAAEHAVRLKLRNHGALAQAVAASLRRSGAPVVLEGACDSTIYDYDDTAVTPWFDRPETEATAHVDGLLARGAIDGAEAEALKTFVQDGYVILPDTITPDHLARLNAALDDAVETKVEGYEWGSSQRMHGLHERYPAVRELWLHPKVLRMLDLIYGAPARPCQSLTYIFGSQQEHHQDTIHLTPFPAGYMCGVWTALEDVQPNSGELVVFPRSHRMPRIYTETAGAAKVTDNDWAAFSDKVVPRWTDLIVQNRLGREIYRPKAGTVLIWHENLLHAGSPRKDLDKSRRSIVCHYFAEGAVAYYDSSGLPGAVYAGDRA